MRISLDEPIEYARARYGDAARVRVLEVERAVRLMNVNEAAEIEVARLGDYFVVSAGSIWYEATTPGTRPVLWLMDLAMTFGVVEFRSLLARVSLAAPSGFVARYGLMPWRREVRRWLPWQGVVRERSQVAQEFGLDPAFGPNEAKVIVFSRGNRP